MAGIKAQLDDERAERAEREAQTAAEIVALVEERKQASAAATQAVQQLTLERQAHQATAAKLEALRAKVAEEDERMRKFEVQEAAMREASGRMDSAINSVRVFLEETAAELEVDFSCLSCLNPLLEPVVLVPCGHSVCQPCYIEMEGAAGSGVLENAKFCPICNKMKRRVDAQPCEGFSNQMLDAVLSRMRTKHQDAETLNNIVANIGTFLVQADYDRPETMQAQCVSRSNRMGRESM